MKHALKAFPTMLRIGLNDAVAYRAEFLIWILATNMPLVMLALWSAVAREHPIGGFGQAEFTAYFLGALVVRLLTGSWVGWSMNYELRQGLLAFRLLRPVHPILHYAAENLAALPMRGLFALPIALGSLLLIGPENVAHDPVVLAVVVVGIFGGWMLMFITLAIIGTLSFFIHNSLALFQVWFGLFTLLSGYLFPLALFPPWMQQVTAVLPFRFMLGFPVEALIGRLGRAQALTELGLQWAYIAAMLLVLRWVWRAGMKKFNAYGG